MGSATVRSGYDAWVSSATPARERPSTPALQLQINAKEAFVYFQNPVPRGATVTSAKLRIYARGSSSGSRTVTAQRVKDAWKAGKVNWNNRPAIVPGSSSTPASFGALSDGDVIELDVTAQLQGIVNGGANYGWKLVTNAGTAFKVHSLDGGEQKPRLVVEWTTKPAAPTSLTPSGGAVSVSKPVLQWDYGDTKGTTALVAARVQIDAAADPASPDWDSAEFPTIENQLDLANPPSGVPSYPGLSAGATTSWRVQVKADNGRWSDWSSWATFSRVAKPTLTITNPPNGGEVWEPTPPITWSLSGGTQESWRVQITGATESTEGAYSGWGGWRSAVPDSTPDVLYDSKRRTGTANSHTLPKGVLKGPGPYVAHVMVWDSVDREATPGDKRYVEAVATFTMDKDPGVTGVTGLSVANTPGTPWVDLTWSRATAPDNYAIYRDGEVIDAQVEPADTITTGSTNTYRDMSAPPHREHAYEVRAVVGGHQSAPTTNVTVTPVPEGIWLYEPVSSEAVVLAETSASFASDDDAGTYTPVGAKTAVRIVNTPRGLAGNVSGLATDSVLGTTLTDSEAALDIIKRRPTRTVWLIAGDLSLPVKVGNLVVAPTKLTRKGRIVKSVAFDFWQTDED